MRIDHWEHKLHDFLMSRAGKPFAWGSNDCCLFVADAIETIIGVDPAKDFRGKYSDQKEAFSQIKSITGGSTVEDVANFEFSKLGFNSVPVLFAQRGDAVLLEGDQGLALGIVHLDGRHALFVSAKGLSKLPVKNCKRAWRVS
jgi:hypothetical protein